MNLPDDFTEIVEASLKNSNSDTRMLTDDSNKILDLIMIEGETNQPDDNLISWKLVSVSSSKLEIELEYRMPIEVSQG